MDLSLATHHGGRLFCTLTEGNAVATFSAANVPQAGDELLAVVESLREETYAECWWLEPDGDYRWIFRRDGLRVAVVVLWCHGIVKGWSHVFRGDCDLEWLIGKVREELELAAQN